MPMRALAAHAVPVPMNVEALSVAVRLVAVGQRAHDSERLPLVETKPPEKSCCSDRGGEIGRLTEVVVEPYLESHEARRLHEGGRLALSAALAVGGSRVEVAVGPERVGVVEVGRRARKLEGDVCSGSKRIQPDRPHAIVTGSLMLSRPSPLNVYREPPPLADVATSMPQPGDTRIKSSCPCNVRR